jgi:hypothetical protein
MLLLFLLGTGHIVLDAGNVLKHADKALIVDRGIEKLHSQALLGIQIHQQTASVGKVIIAASLLVSTASMILSVCQIYGAWNNNRGRL